MDDILSWFKFVLRELVIPSIELRSVLTISNDKYEKAKLLMHELGEGRVEVYPLTPEFHLDLTQCPPDLVITYEKGTREGRLQSRASLEQLVR